MLKVSVYEAKTHLADLLRKVKSGERILITKHHVPLAIMSPASPQRTRSKQKTVEAMKHFRKKHTLQGLCLKEMIEEGRR